jgi:hypothetical protein
MTLAKGAHDTGEACAAGGLLRTAAAAAVAALLITAVLFGGLRAGPAALASSSAPRSGTAAPPAAVRPGGTAPVRYYIVPAAGHGAAVTLFAIAAQTLGNGRRYLEIFSLNKGRLQPNGGRLVTPQAIDTGWILELPADAKGPGVRFGPLPAVQAATPAATPSAAAATHAPAAPVAAAAHGSALSITTALGVLLLIVALIVTAVLATRRPWRHLRPAIRRHSRRPAGRLHGRAARSRASGSAAGPALAAQISARLGRPEPAAPGHPSAPGNPAASGRPGASGSPSAPGQPGGHGPEHPSFPGAGYLRAVKAEQPGFRVGDPCSSADPERPGPRGSRPDGGPGPDRPRSLDAGQFGALGADHPSYPGAGGRLRPVGPQQAPWPGAELPGRPYPGGGTPAPSPDRSRAQHQGAPVGSHHETALAPDPRPIDGQVRGPGGRHAAELARPEPPSAEAAFYREAAFHTDSLRLAERILAEADEQATKIVSTAEQTAAEISQQAAATLTAAEQEAADLRAAMAEITVELGRVAATVIDGLPTPVKPGTRPAARPALKPAVAPATEPAPAARPRRDTADRTARPVTKPGVSPRRAPKPRPATPAKNRQASAFHKVVAAMVLLVLIAVSIGATEISRHGYAFFVFRNAGAGAGNPGQLTEQQGPGQPDAPGARHRAGAAQPGGPASKVAGTPK